MLPNKIFQNRYRLIETLGMGAFGAVYLAEDIEIFARKVVIKITKINDEFQRNLFQREIEILSRISDPSVPRIFDAGITEDGNSYIVSEYIEGVSLDRLLRERERFSVKEALEITLYIAKGLSALHNIGVLHRDVKPSNIVLVPGTPKTTKLIDFGVVGVLEDGLTPRGQIVGTPLYMAPEQIGGYMQSPAADVYSLGVTLYEMLFGRRPFDADSMSALIDRKLRDKIVFPSALPQQVESFLRRCLSISPEDRPQSGEEVVAEIHRLLRRLNGNIASPPPPVDTLTPSPSPVPRRKFLVAITVIAGIVSTFAWVRFGGRYQILGIVTGALYVACGVVIGGALHKWLKKRRGEAEREAGNLFLSSKSRDSLSMTLAIEVDNLICKVNRVDDKILATSLAIMVKEFQEAKEGQSRQAAIMNVVQLLEKLTTRLSPWYVRHEKLIALSVTVLGIVTGITTVVKTVVDIKAGK
jgi:predicted Ser/Thr protein kinase